MHDAVDATFGQDSDDDSEPPPPFRGSFTDWEDAKYLELPRTVNGTGHTGPSEFCATSI